jgi:hypothetical protein
VAQQKKGTPAGTAVVPFARASKLHVEQGQIYSGITITGAAPGTYYFDVPTYGFLSGLFFTVSATGGTGSAAVYYEDAPWSMIGSITVYDVNGSPLFGPISGHDAYLISKFGGYRLFGPDISSLASIYNKPTTGNFFFILPIFMEFGRDGLGCLANQDASAKYRVQVVLNSGAAAATGPVFTTAPTGYPTVSIQLEGLYRSEPPAVDRFGSANSIAPPASGTTQYWTKQTASPISGAQTLQLTRVGNVIRNHLLVFRDTANGTRATAETSDMPLGAFEYDWDSGQRYIGNIATMRLLVQQCTGYDHPSGCLFFPNTLDPEWLALSEYGDQWMATTGATKLTLRFTPQNSVGLTILTNDIVMASPEAQHAAVLDTR